MSANQDRGKNYSVIQWNRSASSDNDENNVISFPLQAKHGQKYLNLWKIILWNLFIIKILFVKRKEIVSVHSIDFDAIIPSFIFCKLFNKKIIFDIYDKYTESRGISGRIGGLIESLERFFIIKSDVSILADESRVKQHELEFRPGNLMIIENVPEEMNIYSRNDLECKKIKIGYVGGLESKNRGLEDICDFVVGSDKYEFYIAGFGDLDNFFSKKSNEYSNVHFMGSCKHEDGMKLLASCDIVLGMYYLNVKNHEFAAPNKYYEHLMLGKPLLTTLGTPPGDKVMKYDTGWALQDSYDAVAEFLNTSINSEDLDRLGLNAKQLWESKYSSYYKDVIAGSYIDKSHG
ncbi:hypothetical protein [Vibrio chagasii]|uniref:hypothetical protein n=1 Tax=Vibrio chagasii TaxID=170679 RepID=UPI003DA1023E